MIAGVDFSQLDKRAHFLAGSTIAAGIIAAENRYGSDWPLWLRVTVPIAASAVIGEGKELFDKHRSGHTSDVRDFRATTIGGLCATVSLGWTF